MAMPQARDGTYHPASPHSSSGAAESFKGTPDTRITAFSPEDGSTKSARIPRSVGFGSRDSGPIKFPMTSPASLDITKSKSFYRGGFHADRDPFVNPSVPVGRPMPGLSPTATCFSPSVDSRPDEAASQPSAPVKPEEEAMFVHSSLSTDLGLSRCLVVTTSAPSRGLMKVGDVEEYMGVGSLRFSGAFKR
jgi:hypothetical protein